MQPSLYVQRLNKPIQTHIHQKMVQVPAQICYQRQQLTLIPSPKHSFRFMNYNILAESLVDWRKINPNKERFVRWSHRWKEIETEIKYYNPDILCIQEMDDNEQQLSQSLATSGYSKVYKKRNFNDRIDGCATFFRSSKFELVNYTLLELQAPNIDDYFLCKGNVAVLLVLKERDTEENILVVNTHILFNTLRGDIKLLQINIIRDAIRQMAVDIPVIWCGDFNAIPCSPIYEYMKTSSLNYSSFDIKSASNQESAIFIIDKKRTQQVLDKLNVNVQTFQPFKTIVQMRGHNRWVELMNGISVRLKPTEDSKELENQIYFDERWEKKQINKMPFQSVYSELNIQQALHLQHDIDPRSTYEPLMSTYTDSTKGTVDYTWYFNFRKGAQLKIAGGFLYPDEFYLIQLGQYPNRFFASDHISQIIDFELQVLDKRQKFEQSQE